ncbi:MAG: hypothetical protein M5R41_02660 [Bacteroidia bacterium]|nr:hypothetical protein [Bacteroidia bacterium]
MSRLFVLTVCIAGVLLQGCALVKSIAGGNIDRERYALAREAAMLETRHVAALRLNERLQRGFDVEDADATLILSEQLVADAMHLLRGRKGWLDRTMPYTIDSIATVLHHGSATASLKLSVRSETHDVDVSLLMDCVLAFVPQGNELVIEMDPFNVQPAVQAPGLLSVAEEIIEDVIRVKLGTMKDEFPPVRMPLSFDDVFTIDGTRNEVRSKVNIVLDSPRRMLAYKLRITDLLVFDEMVVLAISLGDVRGR